MIKIYNAKCIVDKTPIFSWKLTGDSNQVAYRIKVENKSGNNIWDSGRQSGKERHNIKCDFQLADSDSYRWYVTCYGLDGSEDTAEGNIFYSEINEWNAKWIEPERVRRQLRDNVMPHQSTEGQADPIERLDPAIYMRKTFSLDKIPEDAIAYITAHGIYALWINGTQVADLLAPGCTSYDKRLEYQCYDITKWLQKGENVIGVVLADGWYTGKIGCVGIGQQYGTESALLLQIECKFTNGEIKTIYSDEEFKWNTGALRYADLFVGEYYDEELEHEGWLKSDYRDDNWNEVVVKDYGFDTLSLQNIEPVKVLRTIKPKVFRSPKGELIIDAGETIVGFTAFKLSLKKGDVIKLEHSETLDINGNFLQNIIGQNKHQTDYYRCFSDGIKSWNPQFTYHGFRYVKVTGIDESNILDFTIVVIGTDLDKTGEFLCSDERINRLQENIVRSQEGNMVCIPTDCPQREKTGWTGDIQVYAPTACYEMDMERFLIHWLKDMQNEQWESGLIPHVIPCPPSHNILKPEGVEESSAAGWSDAAVIVPWRLYEFYGNLSILKDNFPMMCKYMQSVENVAAKMPTNTENMSAEQLERQKYLWNTDFQYGDWLMPSIPAFEGSMLTGSEVATLMFAITTELMVKICDLLGEESKKEHYYELNNKIKQAFRDEYMNSDGTMKKDLQGIYILALAANVIPEHLKKVAVKKLADLIHKNNDLLATGFLSVPYLLPILHKNGEEGLANKLLFRDECPSWLYEVKMGATTMWESWDCYAEDGTPSNNSMNHFAFGCVGEYLFQTIMGIKALKPGFSEVLIQPDFNCGLNFVKGHYDTIWGKIEVSWKKIYKRIELDITIPPDIEATVVLGNKESKCQCGTWHFDMNV